MGLMATHAADIVLRNSWVSFRKSAEKILQLYLSWFNPFVDRTNARVVKSYSQEDQCPFLKFFFDGFRNEHKLANLERHAVGIAAEENLRVQLSQSGIDSDFKGTDLSLAVRLRKFEAMDVLINLSNELGIQYTVCLQEAEHQMYADKKEMDLLNKPAKVVSYDTDFVALLLDGVFLDNKGSMFRNELQYLAKLEALLNPEVIGQLKNGKGERKVQKMANI